MIRTVVMRLYPDGSVDRQFGDGGLALGPRSSAYSERLYDVTIAPGGEIYLHGGHYVYEGTLFQSFIARLHSDGSPDESFGDNGRVISGAVNWPYSLALLPDGAMILTGVHVGQIDNDMVLVRFDANGRPDSAFGANGVVITDLGYDETADRVLPRGDGTLLVSGVSVHHDEVTYDTSLTLALYNTDGSLDARLGDGGLIATAYGKPVLNAMVFDGEGRGVTVGYELFGGSGNPNVFSSKPFWTHTLVMRFGLEDVFPPLKVLEEPPTIDITPVDQPTPDLEFIPDLEPAPDVPSTPDVLLTTTAQSFSRFSAQSPFDLHSSRGSLLGVNDDSVFQRLDESSN
jgi:uncharacterized delta-60 repeat protein